MPFHRPFPLHRETCLFTASSLYTGKHALSPPIPSTQGNMPFHRQFPLHRETCPFPTNSLYAGKHSLSPPIPSTQRNMPFHHQFPLRRKTCPFTANSLYTWQSETTNNLGRTSLDSLSLSYWTSAPG